MFKIWAILCVLGASLAPMAHAVTVKADNVKSSTYTYRGADGIYSDYEEDNYRIKFSTAIDAPLITENGSPISPDVNVFFANPATATLNMNNYGIINSSYTDYVPTPEIPYKEGRLYYDSDTSAFTAYNDEADVSLQIGRELYIRVTNKSGATITDGSVVYQTGVQGNRPTIGLACSSDTVKAQAIGIATHDIENNTEGYITTYGKVREYDTSSFTGGDLLYISTFTAGQLTNVTPIAPNFPVIVASALNSTNNGDILVQIGPTDVTDGMVINSLTVNNLMSAPTYYFSISNTTQTYATTKTYDWVIGNDINDLSIDYYACSRSTYTCQDAFQKAADNASSGDVIYVTPGFYMWNSSITITTPNITFITEGATIEVDPNRDGLSDVNTSTLFYVNASSVTIKGFNFDGNNNGVNCITVGASIDYTKIHDTVYTDCGKSNDADYNAIYVLNTADYGEIVNAKFINCDGGETIDLAGAFWRVINAYVEGSSGDTKISGNDNAFTNIQTYTSDRLVISGDRNFFQGFNISNDAGVGIAIITQTTADSNVFANGNIVNHAGAYAAAYMQGNYNVLSNVTFKDITNNDAIILDGTGMTVTGCTFTGTIDDYCINILSGKTDNSISNCVANNISGELGFLNDASGNATNQYNTCLSDGDASYVNAIIEPTIYRSSLTANGTFYANERVFVDKVYHVYGGTDSANVTITLSQNVWRTVSNADNDLWTGLEFDGFSITNDTMTIANSGDYFGTVSISYEGSLQKDYAFRVYNITQAAVEGFTMSTTGRGASNYGNLTLPIYIEATANDNLVLQVTNTSGNESIIIHDAIFYINYLHD